jgi:AcrR family transcriptional regulator
MAQAGNETRQRIEETALRLFTEKGYDLTSLREIAEELGVTKAALYYHFKSKEEILESIVKGRQREMQAIIDWASSLPRGLESRKAILERISVLAENQWKPMIRFSQVNQVRMKSMGGDSAAQNMQMMRQLFSLICEAEADQASLFRSALAVIAIFVGAVGIQAIFPEKAGQDFREVALASAVDLIS